MSSIDKRIDIPLQLNAGNFEKIQIRSFAYKDLILMERLERICFPPEQVFTQAVLKNFIYNYNSVTLCMTRGRTDFLGFLIFSEIEFKVWELMTIDVQPSARGKGLGHQLLTDGIGIVEKHEPERIILHVSITNDNAIKLYLKFGFNIVKNIRNYYNSGQDAYLMKKEYGND
jgi:ribosomal-protein-alanine N-acetyltransferase